MKLIPSLPSESFVAWPNIKFYPGYLRDELLSLLDTDTLSQIPGKNIMHAPTNIDKKQIPHHFFVRHLESNYNAYKSGMTTNKLWLDFLAEEHPTKKQEKYVSLCEHFLENVDIDSRTGLSPVGHKHGEEMSLFYARFFKEHPELFPERIMVSPYYRTRLTLDYILRDVAWLDINLDFLHKHPEEGYFHPGMEVWAFHGKPVVIKFTESIRERDHGKMDAPWRFAKEMDRFNSHQWVAQTMQKYMSTLLSDGQYDEEHYYKASVWGESQTQVNIRAEKHMNDLKRLSEMTTLSVSHHLVGLGKILKTMWGGIYNFKNFDHNWKPANGSLSVIVKVPETDSGQSDKMRFAAYNLMPSMTT